MPNYCRLLPTEYSRNYVKRRPVPAEIIVPRDRFSERIEEGEIDPRVASIPAELDEAAEQLVRKHILDYQQSVYQVFYKDHWTRRRKSRPDDPGEETEKEKDLQSELLLHIEKLYFNPHTEKVLAPPPTAKRMLGYIRPKLLHGSLSTYQDTFARTGATVMLRQHEKRTSGEAEDAKGPAKLNDPCAEFNIQEN
ncbi:uncharacterized protein LOC143259254 [Megalopta genalis]|uniref:uncharacterized protein LOC143259254 n=1 Tax=Megalopta genalis TaxID=115081 RepID=UPI003FD48A5F